MGYTTEFSGKIKIDPPLNAEEIKYLQEFSESRRMNRKNGPYYVAGTGFKGQGSDADVIDYNSPPPGQPGLWCGWTVSDDGKYIEWNEVEKFYYADAWMMYLINHFIGTDPIAKTVLPFLGAHICNGVIKAQGEDMDDRWKLFVNDNVVTVENLE